jgi:hypothetical protein
MENLCVVNWGMVLLAKQVTTQRCVCTRARVCVRERERERERERDDEQGQVGNEVLL